MGDSSKYYTKGRRRSRGKRYERRRSENGDKTTLAMIDDGGEYKRGKKGRVGKKLFVDSKFTSRGIHSKKQRMKLNTTGSTSR